MEINGNNILLTGACGGIGSVLARRLASEGARLMLADRNAEALDALATTLPGGPETHRASPRDLAEYQTCAELVAETEAGLGSIDMLVNLAGIQDFVPFEETEPARIELQLRINLMVPMWLSRAALPGMLERGKGLLVNIGSTFGSIGFAHFATYSASKFGVRGFSEALRRELAETPVKVIYVAPRATRTAINRSAVYAMGRKTGMNIDTPEKVAEAIVHAIHGQQSYRYIGFPEKLFVRLNALFPRLVDRALRRQNRVARTFARQT